MSSSRTIMTFTGRKKALVLVLALAAVAGALFVLLGSRFNPRKWRTHVEEVELPGASISYRDLGHGTPAAVIVSGMACIMDDYYKLQLALEDVTRVIAFDRPGLGHSRANAEPRSLDVIDKDMKNLLAALAVPPPYVLIGHSLGGHIIRYYANKHPDEVAGLVFLDHPHEDWLQHIRDTWPRAEAEAYFQWWTPANEAYTGTSLEEMLAYEKNCDMVRGIEIAPDVPVLMFTANNVGHFRKTSPGKEADQKAWEAKQTSLLEGVKDAKQIVDWEVGHMLHHDKPELVEAEIEKFIAHVRATSSPK